KWTINRAEGDPHRGQLHFFVRTTFTTPIIGCWSEGRPPMREESIRSLLLLDSNPEERRLISAIAGRAGWSVVGAADEEMAAALLQGPHGREVQAVLLGNWDVESGPQLINSLRDDRSNLPVVVLSHSDTVSVAVEAMRAGASDFLVRPVAPER